MIDRLNALAPHRGLILQLLRYGITGVLVTVFSAGLYWVLAKPIAWPEQVANVIAWVAAVAVGYVVHSNWSFRGHGNRSSPARIRARFFAVAFFSLALNSLWVFLATDLLNGPEWWPIPAMVLVTPLIIFPLNRRWVFG